MVMIPYIVGIYVSCSKTRDKIFTIFKNSGIYIGLKCFRYLNTAGLISSL